MNSSPADAVKHRYSVAPVSKYISCFLLLMALLNFQASAEAQQWQNFGNADDVLCLLDDGDVFWAGSNNFVIRYDKLSGASKLLSATDGLAAAPVRHLAKDDLGRLWIGSQRSLFRYDGERAVSFSFLDRDGVRTGAVRALRIGSDRIYVGFNDRLAILDLQTGALQGSLIKLPVFIDYIIEAADGRIWAFGLESVRQQGSNTRFFPNAMRIAADGSFDRYQRPQGMPEVKSTLIGFSSNTRRFAALQDREGQLWVGGSEGLARFDGDTWQRFDRRSDGKGPWSGGELLAVDSAGNLWCGGFYGLTRYNGDTWENMTRLPGLSDSLIRDLTVTPAGTVWAATKRGTFRLSEQNWVASGVAQGLPDSLVNILAAGRNDEVLAGMRLAAAAYNGSEWRHFRQRQAPLNGSVRAIALQSDGLLWAAYQLPNGLSRYDGTEWRHFDSEQGLPNDTLHDVTVGRNDELWIAGRHGVSRLNGGTWETVFLDDSSHGRRAYETLQVDSSGSLWMTTRVEVPIGPNSIRPRYEVLQFDGSEWINWARDSDDTYRGPAPSVARIAVAPAGDVYVITGVNADFSILGGRIVLHRYRDGAWEMLPTEYSTPVKDANPPSAISAAPDGSIWVAYTAQVVERRTFNGHVSRFDGREWQHYTATDGLPFSGFFSVQTSALEVLPSAKVLVGVNNAGAGLFTPGGTWETLDDEVGLVNNFVRDIKYASDGCLWFATAQGLSRLCDARIADVPERAADAVLQLLIAPNPLVAGAAATMRLTSARNQQLRVRITDLPGRRQQLVFEGPVAAHETLTLPLATHSLSAGVYFVEATGAQSSTHSMLVIQK